MFIAALYLPWCRYLAAHGVGVQPQLYADARFTTGYVRLVGQEPAPSKCVLMSTSWEVREDVKV